LRPRRRAAAGGRVALGAGRLEYLARERECSIFVEVAALADLSKEGVQAVGADWAVDDRAFTDVRLGSVPA
jgi:hypothetical protein